MHSEMSTPLPPGHAPPSMLTVQHPQGLTRHGDSDCQLELRHHTAASVETWELQYSGPSAGGACDVSIPEVLQLPSGSSQVLACSSSVVQRVASSLDYTVDQNRPSSIDPRPIDHDSRVMQGHAPDYIMNHGTTLLPSYYGVEWPSGYPQESGNVPTFGNLDNSFAALMMGLGAIPPPHNDTAGQVIDSNVPRPHLPNSAPTSAEEPHPRLPALEYASTHQAPTNIPSQSNSTSYSTPTSSRNSSSWSLQEDPGYFAPVQPHSQQICSADSPGFHTGNQVELHAPSAFDNHAAQGHSDHPSHTLSDHRSMPCGWRDDEGNECGTLVHPDHCKDHFADVHGIKRMAWYTKIICCWCPSGKEVSRKYFLRHIKEVHLGCSCSNNGSTVLP